MINLESLLLELKTFVKQLGKYQLDERSKCEAFKKGDSDIVTNVDLESEKQIIDFFSKYKFNILSEEIGFIDNKSEFTCIIDPLDGTRNYAQGKDEFSISIVIMEDCKLILGVVYVPMLDKLFSAIEGKGAYLNDEKISVSQIEEVGLSTMPISYNFNSVLISRLNINKKKIGSLSYRISSIAEGINDLIIIEKTKLWDVAAGIVILEEAGGKVSNFKNEKLILNSRYIDLNDILISNKIIHLKIIDKINLLLNN